MESPRANQAGFGRYRMFVDEVGHADLKSCQDPNGRYLSLTGIIFELAYYDLVVVRQVEQLKEKHFPPLSDGRPLILHRKELVNKSWPFTILRDPEREEAFNQDLLFALESLDYVVLTTTIDKLEHVNRNEAWRRHPYHYCQEVLLECFARWLNHRNARGDVYGESRGRREDRELKTAARFTFHHGTGVLSREVCQRVLIDEDLKLYRKSADIAGLQLADLIAHPSFKRMMARRAEQELPSTFGGRIARILEASKYDRNPQGMIDGWGCQWLP